MELKVGDKVRATVDECDITIGREYVVTNFEKHSNKVYVIDDAGDRWPLMHNEYEPLPVADATEEEATLKIEAGKYYRTRDGRKVGPAVPNHIAPISYPWNIPYDGAYHAYEADGTSCIDDNDDLVAEWPDEQPAVVASKPKFKVGDMVRCISQDDGNPTGCLGSVVLVGCLGSVVLVEGDAPPPYLVRFDDWTDGHGVGNSEWWMNEEDIEPAVVADQPAPASANDNQAPTTLNFNTTDANAKLDEIIAKLKLIDEMASELGISFTTQQAA